MPTLLCVPIMVESVDRALSEAAQAGEHGADLVEYRVDELFSGPEDEDDVLRLVERSPLPCILTCRPVWEGGHYDGEEDARIAMFERLGRSASPPAFIDAELAALARSANERLKIGLALGDAGAAPRLILSSHDFTGRPPDLTRRVLAMQTHASASVHKVAFRARSLRDNLELFDLAAQSATPTIALAMGEFGLPSRVLAPKFGAFLTFASLREASATAPGQPTIAELLERYRFRSIGPSTRVYGVIGWPVAHSMGPLLHNAGFEHTGHDGVYLPLPVAPGQGEASYASFKATLLELLAHTGLGLAGCSVTLPYKEHLVRLAREQHWPLDNDADACGAANTLTAHRDARGNVESVRVGNTDAHAVLACLERAAGPLHARPVTILGAGGVARAAAFALTRAGAVVTVTNRSPQRAQTLAAQAGALGHCRAVPWETRHETGAEVFVQCTPVGMAGGPEGSPLEPARINGNATLLETVYNPVRTRLLSAAHDAGWRTVDGVDMFVEQGAAQFEEWTGRPAPREMFSRLVRGALSASAQEATDGGHNGA
jgi:3-dehydroquinate dehydratase / shikimate dehydrogenase